MPALAHPRATDDATLLRSAFDSLEVGTAVLDGEGTILAVNRQWTAFAAWAGLRPAAAGVGACFLELARTQLPDAFARRLGEATHAVLARGEEHTAVRGRWTRGGRPRHLLIRLHPVEDHDVARAVVRVVDNTKWQRTKDALDEATARANLLALVAQHSHDTVAITDAAGRIEWVNDAFTDLTGYRLDEVRGSTHGVFDQSSRETQGPAFAAAGLVPDPSAPVDAVVSGRSKSGEEYWSHVLVQPVPQGGPPARWVVVGRDVTAQRQAKDKLEETSRRSHALAEALAEETAVLSGVLASIPHLVYWKDAELRYSGVNDAFVAVRRLRSAAQAVGRTEAELGDTGPLAAALTDAEREVVSGSRPVVDRRVAVEVDGRTRHFLLTVLPRTDGLSGGGRECEGVIGIATDVTEVSQLEHQLAQSSRLESIGRLAAGVAHEINTPLQYVTVNTEFLAENVGPVLDAARRLPEAAGDADLEFLAEEVPTAIAQSREGLDRVTKIVRAMKDFSHMGEERTPVDLNHVVESTVAVSRNEWRYVADVELDLDPELPTVPGVEGELKQVVLNILVNAAQAIEEQHGSEASEPAPAAEGRGRIAIATVTSPESVRLRIADDGPGIPDHVRPKIFDPFFTTKAVGEGTGQGLSLAYACIVQKHGGGLDVECPSQGGTVFTITLPRTPPGPPSADGDGAA